MTSANQTDRKSGFTDTELMDSKDGRFFGLQGPQLPVGQMSMISRITEMNSDGGKYGKGEIHAELDINSNLWFFECHFPGDPVMPGCLGLDALWQMVGFYLGWLGYKGKGRALGAKEVKFSGQVTNDIERIHYHIQFSRIINRKLIMGIADGTVLIDDQVIYQANDLKVGLFE